MQKKLSKSVILFLTAMAFFCGWYSFVGVLILTLVALIVTDDEKFQKNVLNAFFLALFFIAVGFVLGKLSLWYVKFLGFLDGLEWLKFFTYEVYSFMKKLDIASYIRSFLDFVEFVLMIVFIILALKDKEIKIPLANNLAEKVLGVVSAVKSEKKEEVKEEVKAEENPITSEKATLTEIPKE